MFIYPKHLLRSHPSSRGCAAESITLAARRCARPSQVKCEKHARAIDIDIYVRDKRERQSAASDRRGEKMK
jgi:hypothetical protein